MDTEETTSQEEVSDNQIKNSKPWLWKKGQSGNLLGRPKGKTLKEYVKEYLSRMTDEERDEWLSGLNKTEIWRMAEGNPAQDLTSGGEKLNPVPIYGGLSIKHQGHDSNKEDISVE